MERAIDRIGEEETDSEEMRREEMRKTENSEKQRRCETLGDGTGEKESLAHKKRLSKRTTPCTFMSRPQARLDRPNVF